MPDLRNEKDTQETKRIAQDRGRTLKIPEGQRTPVYLLSSKYGRGFVHWIDLPGQSSPLRVVCGGGEDGKGYAPEECAICKWVDAQYKASRAAMNSGRANEAEKIKKAANRVNAKFEVQFIAAAGSMLATRKNGKKVWVPDWDDIRVGILPLSKRMWDDLTAVVNSETFDYIHGGEDLVNRVIVFDKHKEEGELYSRTSFVPSRSASDPPKAAMEFDLDEFDVQENFQIERDEIKKAARALSGKSDATVDYEDDGDEEDEMLEEDDADDFDDDFLDEEDEDNADDDDDDADDDDLEDDNEEDFEEVEEEEKVPAKAKRKPAAKPAAKKAPAKRVPATRRRRPPKDAEL